MQPYERLRSAGVDVVAIGTRGGKHEISGLNLPVRLGSPSCSSRLLPAPLKRLVASQADSTKIVRIERLLADRSIMHAAETFIGLSAQCAALTRIDGRPLVVTCWENIPFQHERKAYLATRKRNVVAATSIFIAVTPEAAAALRAEGVPASKIVVIPAAVNLDRFSVGPRDSILLAQHGVHEHERVVLFVGRLIAEKGWEDLVGAIASLEIKSFPLRVVFIGAGGDRRFAERLVNRLAVRATFVEFVAYDELPRWYRSASVVVVPSRPTPYWQEQFGMVLAEAMASGCAIVTTKSGSIPSVVADAAELVEPYNPLDIAAAIRKIIETPSMADDLRKRARRRAEENYDDSIVAGQLFDVYRGVS